MGKKLNVNAVDKIMQASYETTKRAIIDLNPRYEAIKRDIRLSITKRSIEGYMDTEIRHSASNNRLYVLDCGEYDVVRPVELMKVLLSEFSDYNVMLREVRFSSGTTYYEGWIRWDNSGVRTVVDKY